MSDAVNDAELGRSKQSTSPSDHLQHLLGLGWAPNSPLILKYVAEKGLQRELSQWQALNAKMTGSKDEKSKRQK